ncbi:hypothetical protein Barb6_03905 [Bacteroidales bacterium Barb6]|nr:hypothetical protein Barb4_05530 [Bacteroidales bacterium Barb4]OAV63225.1 hypothetical protein Barb6_03905 [Bacteroidales bacterium Barb6]OAV75925.1 hypothetical protein Barb7_00410 [Bacteroidales bacterium Barb7]
MKRETLRKCKVIVKGGGGAERYSLLNPLTYIIFAYASLIYFVKFLIKEV